VTKHQNSLKWISNSLSRRDVLRAGGLLLPASLIAPALFTQVSRAAGSGAFDYYISTNGNDSNPGTLALPWAITGINTHQSAYSGKRVGILPGTYDISVKMANCTVEEAILQINGGPNSSTPTYIGTSDSSGQYQPGTATLDCFGSVGQYGGGNGIFPYPIGQTDGGGNAGPQPANLGNWILDGLNISGFSRWAVTLADSGGGPGQIQNVTLQNLTLHNSVNPTLTTHPAPIMLYRVKNVLVSNCWLYNNASVADQNHYAGILIFGVGGPSTGIVIEKCTFGNSSCIYGAEDNSAVDNVTIRQCYFDMTLAGTNFNQPYAIQGFGKSSAGLIADSFHNNIVKGGNLYDMGGTAPSSVGVAVYNNTWDRAGGAGYGNSSGGIRMEETSGNTKIFSCYNNLIYDNGASSLGEYGYIAGNTDGFSVCDYNIYGTIANGFYTYGANGGGGVGGTSFSGWKSATGGDAHSTMNSTNPFTNSGANALQYQISQGSPAYQSGRVGGVASGATCNVGAWDGAVTQIGYSAGATAVAMPKSPVLVTVT
jgi:hypothetical protein